MRAGARAELSRLEVYRLGLEFVDVAFRCAAALPYDFRWVADQLRRAALSIVLNTAEGAGEFSPAEKRRFYRMARRSAFECVPLLDVLERARLTPAQHARAAHGMLDRLARMLTSLSRPPRPSSAP
jgi:four helix bundle protein